MALSQIARDRLLCSFGITMDEQTAAKELADALDYACTGENTATPLNVPSTPVKRDASGGFTAGSIELDGNLKLNLNRSIVAQDAHDPLSWDYIVRVLSDGTIYLGGVNTNGIAIGNEKEFKCESVLNPGTFLRIGSVDPDNTVNLGSGNANELHLHTGGLGSDYAMTLMNGGNTHLRKRLLIGDSRGGTVMGGEVDIVDEQGVDPNKGTAGIGLASYRNSDIWGSFVYGIRYRGTLSVPTACQSGDSLMEFGCLGWDGASPVGGGELMWVVDGAVSAGKVPARAELYVTKANGTTTLATTFHSNLLVETYGDITSPGNVTAASFSVGLTPGIDHTEVINAKTFVWSKGLLISVT